MIPGCAWAVRQSGPPPVAARGTIEYAPNADVFVRITGDYTDDWSHPRQGHRLIPGLVTGAPVLDLRRSRDAGTQGRKQAV